MVSTKLNPRIITKLLNLKNFNPRNYPAIRYIYTHIPLILQCRDNWTIVVLFHDTAICTSCSKQ